MIDFTHLVGGVIREYEMVEDDNLISPYPSFLVFKGQKVYQVDVACDEEFNGGGKLHIEDITDETIG